MIITIMKGNRRDMKKQNAKNERLRRLLHVIESSPRPDNFKKEPTSPEHNKNGPAIFIAAMSTDSTAGEVSHFAGTARKAGYDGDLVVAVLPNSKADFMAAWTKYKGIVYMVNPDCTGTGHDKVCSFKGQDKKVSINMVRYFLYQWWGAIYNEGALIMLSDFRDVIFQSNPFLYRKWEWAPPVAQLVVFQEAYPNKVIYRCVFNGGWVENCYGTEGLKRVGSNTVSCSGVTIGTRDAIVVYAHLITQQLDPRVRYGRNTTKTNQNCISLGMDQGFHNWLVYSGQLDKYMDIKVYQQGEGPVNTVGAFFGERALLKFDLKTWKVLQGEGKDKWFHNWNGDKSPVIHQYDRFLSTDLNGGIEAHLGMVQNLQ